MRVIGFSFDRINVERLKDNPREIKINTNIDISEIKEIKTDILKTKENILKVVFSYIIKYEPGFAHVELRGHILLSIDEKSSKEVLKDWKKKLMPGDFRTFIFNVVLRKSSIKALALEDELSLPLHMPLPRIKSGNEK